MKLRTVQKTPKEVSLDWRSASIPMLLNCLKNILKANLVLRFPTSMAVKIFTLNVTTQNAKIGINI